LGKEKLIFNKTPADLASITVEGQNKWLTIIQNASKVTRVNTDKKVIIS
jgi:hypothetical protein